MVYDLIKCLRHKYIFYIFYLQPITARRFVFFHYSGDLFECVIICDICEVFHRGYCVAVKCDLITNKNTLVVFHKTE